MSIFKEKKGVLINEQLVTIKEEILNYLNKTKNLNVLSSEMGCISTSRLRLLLNKPNSFYSLSIAKMLAIYDYIKQHKK